MSPLKASVHSELLRHSWARPGTCKPPPLNRMVQPSLPPYLSWLRHPRDRILLPAGQRHPTAHLSCRWRGHGRCSEEREGMPVWGSESSVRPPHRSPQLWLSPALRADCEQPLVSQNTQTVLPTPPLGLPHCLITGLNNLTATCQSPKRPTYPIT